MLIFSVKLLINIVLWLAIGTQAIIIVTAEEKN